VAAVATAPAAFKKSKHQRARLFAYLTSPVGVLLIFFIGPMAVLGWMSVLKFSIAGVGGFTGLDNYRSVMTDPTYWQILWTTFEIATASMVIILVIALPLASVLAFRVRRWELQLLLLLVLADQLNPLIRVYAWRILLGKNGIINGALMAVGLIHEPIAGLLFSKTAVIIVTSAEYLAVATIPIYAALKAVDPSTLEAANDLGAGSFTLYRKILIPLAAPGIFVALILVYIPLFTEFLTPALVGGTSGFMIGNYIEQEILKTGNWGVGSAMSFLLLLFSVVFVAIMYRLGRINRLQTASTTNG
jgi:ABC-type spermidine/putrescine transport system permease subunit I